MSLPDPPTSDPDSPTSSSGRLAALASPPFRLLMAAGMVMQLGSWIQRVALLWVVYDITGSAVSLAALGFLTSIFVIVLSPAAGVLSDRFGARRVLIFASIGQAAAAGILAGGVLTEHASLGLLYGVAATFGIGQALNQPTRNLLVYDSVGRDLLRNGLALNALTGSTMRIVGPTIGGLIVAAGGGGPAFALQAILLAAAVVLVWRLPIETKPVRRGGVWSELIGGLRHLRENAPVRRSVIVSALTSTLVYPYLAFIPVFATENLGGGAREQGILFSAGGFGSMVGLWYVVAGRGGMRTMLWTGTAYMALVIAFTQATHFWYAFALLVTAGIVHSVFSTLNQALVQLNASEEYRGRVMGIYSMVNGFEPFSVLALGPLIEGFGVSRAAGAYVALAMLLTLAFAVAATFSERRRGAAAPARG